MFFLKAALDLDLTNGILLHLPHFLRDGVGTGLVGTANTIQPVVSVQPYVASQPGTTSGISGGVPPQPHGGSAIGTVGRGSLGPQMLGGSGCVGHSPVSGFQPAIGNVGRGSPGPHMTKGGTSGPATSSITASLFA